MLLKVFRPNLIDYINQSKVLDNYTKRCKCTSGKSRVGLVRGERGRGNISFSLKNISSYDPSLTLRYLRQGQVWSLRLLYGKTWKLYLFFENYCSL